MQDALQMLPLPPFLSAIPPRRRLTTLKRAGCLVRLYFTSQPNLLNNTVARVGLINRPPDATRRDIVKSSYASSRSILQCESKK